MGPGANKQVDCAELASPDDQVVDWLRKKYASMARSDGTEVPPHLRGERPQRYQQQSQEDFEKSNSFRLMELGLVL